MTQLALDIFEKTELIPVRQCLRFANPTPLYQREALKRLERLGIEAFSEHALMWRAGASAARLLQAQFPLCTHVLILIGTGNNGGDGMVCAQVLKEHFAIEVSALMLSKTVKPSLHPMVEAMQRTGVNIFQDWEDLQSIQSIDVVVDALFGIGLTRALDSTALQWVKNINALQRPIVSIDIPSGLDSDTGVVLGEAAVCANITLCMLGVSSGVVTGQAANYCGELWLAALGVVDTEPVHLYLNHLSQLHAPRLPNDHKGRRGDCVVIGGDQGMLGAAVLAARAASTVGAGKVYIAAIHQDAHSTSYDGQCPELMMKSQASLYQLLENPHHTKVSQTVFVLGVGGGEGIASVLTKILDKPIHRMVVDADALNHIAQSPTLRKKFIDVPTPIKIMTPHPLEASRLLKCSIHAIESQRLQAAQKLAETFQCWVVLKGSGSVIANTAGDIWVNLTGNARLATAGSGDVLSGMIGALWTQGLEAGEALKRAVFWHGYLVERENNVYSKNELCETLPHATPASFLLQRLLQTSSDFSEPGICSG